MLSDVKRLISQVSFYGLSNIVERSQSFLLLPIHTNYLVTEDFGLTTQTYVLIAFLNILYLYGMDSAFLRFFIMKEPGFTRKRVFNTIVYTVAATAVLMSIVLMFNIDRLAMLLMRTTEYRNIIIWLIGIIFFDTLAIFPFLTLRAEEKPKLFAALKSVKVFLTLLLNLFFIAYLHKGFEYIFIIQMIASGSILLFLIPVFIKYLSFEYSGHVLKEMLKFGLPYIGPYVAVISIDHIDKLMLGRMIGDDIVGVYGAGYRLAMAMNLFVAAFRFAWHPFFLSIAERDDAKSVYSRVMTYFLMFAGWMYIGISFFVEYIVKIPLPFIGNVLGESYLSGIGVVPYVMPAYILFGVYSNLIVGIHIKKRSYLLPFITGIAAVVCIVLNYLLIPDYTMYGAAVAKTIGYGVMVILLFAASTRFYYVKYEYLRIMKLLIITAVLFVIPFALETQYTLVLKCMVFIGYPIAFFITGFLSKREKEAALKLLRIKR